MIRRAARRAGVALSTVKYVETHGTGTSLGDPQEANALANVFAADKRLLVSSSVLVLGAVKSNVGHLEAAAGMASLVKALGCLQHGVVTTNLLHAAKLNQYLKASVETMPIIMPTSEEADLDPLNVVGVSSFGFGGTNSHIVLST